MKRLLLLLFAIYIALGVKAQTLTIDNVCAVPMDISAQTHSVYDLNGVKCGLIKVRCVLDGMTFKGNIIGSPEYKDGVYWVYVINGTRMIVAHHPKVLPIDINLVGMLGEPIKSGMTYQVVLGIPESLYPILIVGQQPQTQTDLTELYKNDTVKGIIFEEDIDDVLIGCVVSLNKNYQYGKSVVSNIDGEFKISGVKPGGKLFVAYVGYKTLEIDFPKYVPPYIEVQLTPGKGTERRNFYYDPSDRAEYYDLKGNKILGYPDKKGDYLRIENGKVEKIHID